MTKSITTLIEDIQNVLLKPEITKEQADILGKRIAETIYAKLNRSEERKLRMSNMGTPCERKLWYSINTPELGEKLSPEARLKFLYGDIIEELVLWLAEVAGHEVTGRQAKSDIGGIPGHRDAIVDGHLLDVKSASSYSFKKFQNHLKPSEDSFGYLTQLGAYQYDYERSEPNGDPRPVPAFLVIDKTLGKICLDFQPDVGNTDYEQLAERKKAVVNQPTPPGRRYFDEPDGLSGNRKLGIECSYCDFKRQCWPSLRGFVYSTGPRWLTQVSREPNVPEINFNETSEL